MTKKERALEVIEKQIGLKQKPDGGTGVWETGYDGLFFENGYYNGASLDNLDYKETFHFTLYKHVHILNKYIQPVKVSIRSFTAMSYDMILDGWLKLAIQDLEKMIESKHKEYVNDQKRASDSSH